MRFPADQPETAVVGPEGTSCATVQIYKKARGRDYLATLKCRLPLVAPRQTDRTRRAAVPVLWHGEMVVDLLQVRVMAL